MRKFITLFILLLLAAAALTAVNYSKMTHVALTNSQIDSTRIGLVTPDQGTFTNVFAAEGVGAHGGYSFFADPLQDTGMFSPADGVLSLDANGVEFLHISGPTPSSNSFTGNASTATALAATPTQCATGQIATGIQASGAANCIPAVQGATATGCTTAATSFSTCSTVVTWPIAYASVNAYQVTCSGIGATDPRASINSIAKSLGSVTVTTVTNGSNAVSYSEIDCLAKS